MLAQGSYSMSYGLPDVVPPVRGGGLLGVQCGSMWNQTTHELLKELRYLQRLDHCCTLCWEANVIHLISEVASAQRLLMLCVEAYTTKLIAQVIWAMTMSAECTSQ